jgi:hypothetical protein
MKNIAVCAVFAASTALFGAKLHAQAQAPTAVAVLPASVLAGQAKMTVWGFDVYQAALWVEPGFVGTAYAQGSFALELTYLRDFTAADIAQRSLAEMRRQANLAPQDVQRWEGRLRALLPDVKAGDRITGVHQPGRGAAFWGNGRLLGELADPEFARLFFGIWLAPQTSEPALRRALLGAAP